MWRARQQWRAERCADSAAWCPLPERAGLLALGTYQLQEGGDDNKQTRLGDLHIFDVSAGGSGELQPAASAAGAGVLQAAWRGAGGPGAGAGAGGPAGRGPALAAAGADGRVRVYGLAGPAGTDLVLRAQATVGEDVLALAVDWSWLGGESRLVVSDSSGHVTVYRVPDGVDGDGGGVDGDGGGADGDGGGGGLEPVGRWKAHGFEAWTAAFDCWSPHVFYTGGDDSLFKTFDTRQPAAAAVSRAHGAGVTAVRPHPAAEHALVTGSYDEFVRVWDTRRLARPAAAAGAGGGVWRAAWHPRRRRALLVAAMHGGARVLDWRGELTVRAEYRGHDSMVYGADWKADEDLVATCSFYDCQLHISEVDGLDSDGENG